MKIIKRRLFFDIEVSPNVGIFWTAGFKLNVGYDSILKERAIICICYKWEHEKTVHSLTWDKKQCDKAMLKRFAKIAEDADELVGHNGDNFDLKWIRTRCIFHKIKFTPFIKTIDTLKIARSLFRFNSNKLDYIGQFLGVGGKISITYSLWKDVMNKDAKALAYMVKYCKIDVKRLESVFLKLEDYAPIKTHYGVKNGRAKRSCPKCGHEHTVINNTRISAAGIVKIQLKCKKCGRLHQVPASAIKNVFTTTERRTTRTIYKRTRTKIKARTRRK